jgi:hypothetical protein
LLFALVGTLRVEPVPEPHTNRLDSVEEHDCTDSVATSARSSIFLPSRHLVQQNANLSRR